ncbi:SGNH/GDSL hydrolase family protein [Streptomyces sp. NPDC127061]|uniref:SGNH/GDSL hydrolase family protein n=1 Tax=unclassified Streptomyces TaxID=2593676 RepID=UPI000F5BD5B1|nr:MULTISPECIES: SGNH/GDSL hydrolase family protein [unclassified Streptomyces]WSG50646.1 SGNH/GDSL hydrolase family protein [Streptomyces sp. NBC_01732]WSX01307.1 SGNH/GDSL hydrolase family protein [Streptomyces sp. NBC_00987]MCX4396818.1 SGNH/GDSL hydrolase family protein [Streptomyces sp. NBC_01767]MCX5100540.1 SGNH/GDSL hydrolase family protein [Streptomyces sp. NBC_00439]MCX5160052.1 SGNH/GDSL hydrolase family protein [Streptomyces sp. NBC_00305]
MQDRSARRRSRTAAAVLAAVSLLGTAVLTGCDSGREGTTKGAAAQPSARPGPVWDREPGSVAAVGDSITRGFDACSVLADCPEVSWATGTDSEVRSLAVRLLGASGASTRSWNHAQTGARIAQLPEQMAAAAKEKPDLVTVMIGANDACRDSARYMTPVADFRSSFEASMRQLRAGAPKAQVYVSSVPDLKRLWSTGRGNALGKQIWKLGICRSMLGDADDMGAPATARRASVQDRVVAYNKVLREVCAKDLRCRYDGGAVFDFPFTGKQLSQWDWFHPGRDGQARLAEIAYRNVTAARPPA